MICLDNSVLRRFADPDPDPDVVAYLKTRRSEQWIVPAIVAYEYYSVGSTRTTVQQLQRRLNENVDKVQPFTDAVAVEAATLGGRLREQDRALATADLLSAATAREAGATFVTGYNRDFDKQPLHQLLDVDIIDIA